MLRIVHCCGLVLAVVTASAHGNAGDARRVDTGRRAYAAHCASCHGARGEGQTGWDKLDAAGEMPAPPHDRNGHTWKHSDAMLYRIVKDGWRDPYNRTRRLTMPGFAQTLSPKDIRDVLGYLKAMWTPEQRSFQREESRHASFPPEER